MLFIRKLNRAQITSIQNSFQRIKHQVHKFAKIEFYHILSHLNSAADLLIKKNKFKLGRIVGEYGMIHPIPFLEMIVEKLNFIKFDQGQCSQTMVIPCMMELPLKKRRSCNASDA